MKQGPNILIVVPDTLARMPLAAYGGPNPARTPNMDRMIESGTAFSRCYCATPQCTPSKASLLTGLYPHKAKMMANVNLPGGRPFDTDILTMGRYFQERGYYTGLFGNCHQGVPAECGDAYGFDVLMNEYAIGRDDTEVTRRSMEFMENSAGKPWLAILFYHTAHDISHIRKLGTEELGELSAESLHIKLPDNWRDSLADKPGPQRAMREDYSRRMAVPFGDAEWRSYIEFYNRKVAIMDAELGQVLDKLDGLGMREDTLFVLTGDHGDMCGSHGLSFKGPVMYDEITRVPLVIGWQGVVPAGEKRDQLCHNTDIFPTLCELAGFPPPEDIDGRSLKTCLELADATVHKRVVLEYYVSGKLQEPCPIRALVDERYKYVRYLEGGEELYDMQEDPGELDNLAPRPELAGVMGDMRRALADFIVETDDRLFMEYGENETRSFI